LHDALRHHDLLASQLQRALSTPPSAASTTDLRSRARVPACSEVPVRTKRWNDPREPDDGYRVLICRYRPRGVRKADETWDATCLALAPSAGLHAAVYGKSEPAIDFAEYARRFRSEMKASKFWIEGFARKVREGGTLTLLCSSACTDESHCHRSIVRELIEAVAYPPRTRAGSRENLGAVEAVVASPHDTPDVDARGVVKRRRER
jgi:uncharacterized protein YeaO (DUF488 family)